MSLWCCDWLRFCSVKSVWKKQKKLINNNKTPATYEADLGYLIKLEAEKHAISKEHLEVMLPNAFCICDQISIRKIYSRNWPTKIFAMLGSLSLIIFHKLQEQCSKIFDY